MEDRGVLGGAHPAAKLILLALLALVGLFFTMIIGLLVAMPFFGNDITGMVLQGEGINLAENLNFSRYFQTLSHIGLFVVPALIFALLVGRRPLLYLKVRRQPLLLSLLVSALIMIVALPLVNYLMEINLKLSLPPFLEGLEEWMRSAEDGAEEVTKMFLEVTTWQGLLFNLFMIAVIPSIGEEFIFRGIVLKVFRQWFRNVHVAVWISALLFSAMHMQFFGFLPRLLLGLVLGYLFVWSRNLWIPIFAHFFNNAAAVIFYFLHHNGYINLDIEEVGLGAGAPYYAMASVVLLIALFFYLRNYEQRHEKRLAFD
ncbi:MAG: CPBP family intramembrane glutamic endopeptidase [Bacteroidales bacterium]|jgi:membrane protease YdiL (CAAX protease family)|nr:CPBP family intramembrane glutamic endopeptidase [Bacteroidales bacterium]NLM93524.1 CPBP family intramembrane metalloprotease [Bacteroidales bacterium]